MNVRGTPCYSYVVVLELDDAAGKVNMLERSSFVLVMQTVVLPGRSSRRSRSYTVMVGQRH